ncbi:MAG: DUF2145 domain-containing protein [Pseudomonadota bacterium]
MRMTIGKWCGALALSLVLAAPVQAGSGAGSSSAGGAPSFTPEQIVKFAKKVEKTMAEKGAYVAVIARMGRSASELPEGMHFTHVAFAVYSEITTADGRKMPGYAIYNLYQLDGKPDVSKLVQDYPVDFFAGVAQLESGLIIPSPELQRRILEVIGSPTYKSLHNPHYSLIANPFTLPKQNCTEHTLDVINAAIYQTDDINKIKEAEKKYFKAQRVNVSPLKLMLGSMFSAEVSTSDQQGTPVTATFETIAEYLKQYDKGSQVVTVTPES